MEAFSRSDESSERCAMQNAKSYGAPISVTPTGAALGADVTGVDLSRALDDVSLSVIRRAWEDHLVLRFRGQRLSDDDLMRFSQYFGTLDRAPINPGNVKREEGYV